MNVGVTKKEFIKKYAELLRMTRENVEDLSLVNDETLEIIYCDVLDGFYCEKVNIACSSAMEIIRDVAKAID